MDWAILTTFFNFISLVFITVVFARQEVLSKKLERYIDVAVSHTESLNTIILILQQMEAKQDLMFNSCTAVAEVRIDEQGEVWASMHRPESESHDVAMNQHKDELLQLARRKLREHQLKIPLVHIPKKRGRPKKASDQMADY